MAKILLAPSLLSADFSCLREQVALVEKSGAQWLHFDVMDGHFVPNITFGPLVVKALRKYSGMFFDVHLMITDPDKYIGEFAQAGAENITVHYETVTHLHRTLSLIKSHGCQAGLSFNPATPIDNELIDYLHEQLDLVLIMTVNPGFGGQKFIYPVLEKIKKLKKHLEEKNYRQIKIEVDGGVDSQTAGMVIAAGAEVLVAGSAVFAQPDIEVATKNLLQIINS